MSKTGYVESLISKHTKLEEAIHQAYCKHLPDYEINELKKQRLKIKEEINLILKDFAAENQQAA